MHPGLIPLAVAPGVRSGDRTLFRPTTPPHTMRRRFERFVRTSRAEVLRRHPAVVFGRPSGRRAWAAIAAFIEGGGS